MPVNDNVSSTHDKLGLHTLLYVIAHETMRGQTALPLADFIDGVQPNTSDLLVGVDSKIALLP